MKNDQDEFSVLAPQYGLFAEDFGRVVTVLGQRFRIAGLSPSVGSCPVIARRVDNDKQYRLSLGAVKSALKQSQAA